MACFPKWWVSDVWLLVCGGRFHALEISLDHAQRVEPNAESITFFSPYTAWCFGGLSWIWLLGSVQVQKTKNSRHPKVIENHWHSPHYSLLVFLAIMRTCVSSFGKKTKKNACQEAPSLSQTFALRRWPPVKRLQRFGGRSMVFTKTVHPLGTKLNLARASSTEDVAMGQKSEMCRSSRVGLGRGKIF